MKGPGRTTTTVRVRFFAAFRQTFGGKERIFELEEGTTLGCLLERLGDSSARRAELFAAPEAGKPPALHPHIVVMVNGENASARGGWNGELRAGDTVAVFPLMGGG